MKLNGHILINCFEISEIKHFDKKVRKTDEKSGWRDVTVREFYLALYGIKMSLNRKFNFECQDIIVIGKDMKYCGLAHEPDQAVVFRMASFRNSENHFIS